MQTENILYGITHTGKSVKTLPISHQSHTPKHNPFPSPIHGKSNELLLRADSKRASSLRDQLFAKVRISLYMCIIIVKYSCGSVLCVLASLKHSYVVRTLQYLRDMIKHMYTYMYM